MIVLVPLFGMGQDDTSALLAAVTQVAQSAFPEYESGPTFDSILASGTTFPDPIVITRLMALDPLYLLRCALTRLELTQVLAWELVGSAHKLRAVTGPYWRGRSSGPPPPLTTNSSGRCVHKYVLVQVH